ncbi:MAG: hypothetical protein WBB25_23245, partial [Sulfitobacter sp.]
MMRQTKERADLGFAVDDTGFDPAEWDVGTPAPQRPESATARKVAEATGFRSREAGITPVPAPAAGAGESKPLRRRRTGRNAQFNLKARPDTIESFCDVADAKGWGLGETLEHAVALLQREYG